MSKQVECQTNSPVAPSRPATGAKDQKCLNIRLCPDPTVDDVEWKSKSLGTMSHPHSEQSVERWT
jgi:hypothetical protein